MIDTGTGREQVRSAFAPAELFGSILKNRIAMAPMTRSRAYGAEQTPGPDTVEYYAQRASAGLIVSEGMHPNPRGQGEPDTPGMYARAQAEAWQPVVNAVQAKDTLFFAQLMHSGRVSHPENNPEGLEPVAPSAVRAPGEIYTHRGRQPHPRPRALTTAEIDQTVRDFATAAGLALDAGFDGVTLHAGNGYLLHEFLAENTNLRTDGYGGSLTGRLRFVVEVVEAVCEVVPPHRVLLHLTPAKIGEDIVEGDSAALYDALLAALPVSFGGLSLFETGHRDLTRRLRERWPGPFVLNPHANYGDGKVPAGPADLPLLDEGLADVLSFGRLFLANPDLPARLRAGGPYNEPDRETFYGGGAAGYTDYPALQSTDAR
ncbi:alkene reductase [Amycolatopsis sp. NPDC059090]|uniref:oxidoreductase n=1 Tax=Amycolatopsis sp. NPDC059090 TaxID=3346723 RepID=UPI00366FEA9C